MCDEVKQQLQAFVDYFEQVDCYDCSLPYSVVPGSANYRGYCDNPHHHELYRLIRDADFSLSGRKK